MPASAAWTRPEDLVESLSSLDNTARLKALRDVKNQIIGNKTKKLSYIKLGAVPRVVEILASDTEIPLLVQSAAALGSFACGTDAGVRAVLDSGVLPHLLKMLQSGDSKVAETCARALKMIFHSPLAPRSDMFKAHRMELLLQLLHHENENVSEVAARVLARCCETSQHQQALADAGGLESLVALLPSAVKIREAALDALAALTRTNRHLSECFIRMNHGEELAVVIRLIKDKSPMTRLLACMCLVNVGKACPGGYAHEGEVRANMLRILMKLLEVPGHVGEDAPGVLADLVANNEELQKTAADQNAVEKLADFLLREEVPSKQLEGVLWGLSELCSKLEESRRQLLESKDWKSLNTSFALAAPFLLRPLAEESLIAALRHPCEGVKVAACACVRSLARSVKNLRTSLTSEQFVRPLLQLMNDPAPAVQAEALTAVGNIVLDFTPQKSVIMKTDGITQLANLALSMDHTLRRNAVLALKNLLFLAEIKVKRRVLAELTVSTLCDLIRDPEEDVQEQAISLVRNLVNGDPESVQQMFSDGGTLFQAVEKQLNNPRPEISVQALYVMNNVASGSEAHKEAVMTSILTSPSTNNISWLTRFLQDMSNPQLRVMAVWCVINLLYNLSVGDGISERLVRLRDAGVEAQLHKMVDDSCLDVRNHARTALEYFTPATATSTSSEH